MDECFGTTDFSSLVPLYELLPATLDRLCEMGESNSHLPGLPTGFSDIDRITMGLNPSNLIVLASRPGMGKTSLSLNIALNVAKRSCKKVVIFSPGTPKEDIFMRLLSIESLVSYQNIKCGEMNESDWEKCSQAVGLMGNLGIYIDDSPMITVDSIWKKSGQIENLGCVVVDDLQLIISAGGGVIAGESRYQVLSAITRMLKITARSLNVPVLCVSQLNRDCEKREDKHPVLSDLRDSGTLEDDADIVMFLYNRQDVSDRSVTECIIAKNRHGKTGVAKLRWIPELFFFATIAE